VEVGRAADEEQAIPRAEEATVEALRAGPRAPRDLDVLRLRPDLRHGLFTVPGAVVLAVPSIPLGASVVVGAPPRAAGSP
jgi:hypothetical protein